MIELCRLSLQIFLFGKLNLMNDGDILFTYTVRDVLNTVKEIYHGYYWAGWGRAGAWWGQKLSLFKIRFFWHYHATVAKSLFKNFIIKFKNLYIDNAKGLLLCGDNPREQHCREKPNMDQWNLRSLLDDAEQLHPYIAFNDLSNYLWP